MGRALSSLAGITAVYKDSLFAANCRREDLLRSLTPLPPELVALHSRRLARITGGTAGIAGFVALVISVIAGSEFACLVLVGTWVAMAVAYLLTRPIVRWRVHALARRMLQLGDDPLADVARLERGGPTELVLRTTHRLEAASFMMPLVAFTLLTPLFAHLLIGTTILGVSLHSFNIWVLISLLLVGHAHLTLLILSIMHVLRVRAELDRGVQVQGAARGFWALLWTVAASSIPGAVLLCIPPMLVALTGLLFVPWMFQWASRRAQQERAALEAQGLSSGS